MASVSFPTGNSATWKNVYQLEETDPVQGGPMGVDNQQAKDLGERTEYLKYRLDNPTAPNQNRGNLGDEAANTRFVIQNAGRYASVRECSVVGGVGTTNNLSANDAGALVYAASINDAPISVTMPATNDIPAGQFIAFTNLSGFVMNINRAGTDLFLKINPWQDAADKTTAWLHPGESVAFTRISNRWVPSQFDGNFFNVGAIDFMAYSPLAIQDGLTGYLELKGQTVTRAQYPRLWNLLSAIGLAQNILVSDGDWTTNKGKFSTGNTTTTFRLPDLRGQFIRAWDNGAGIDSGREIGTTQQDELISHRHSVVTTTVGAGSSEVAMFGSSSGTTGNLTNFTGGSETRPKNMAYCAVIRY